MAEVNGAHNDDPNETLDQISADKNTADAGNENDADRDTRRLRNQGRERRRRNAAERHRQVKHNIASIAAILATVGGQFL